LALCLGGKFRPWISGQKGHWEGSIMFKKWLDKLNARNLYNRGTSLALRGQFDEALKILTRAINVDPNFVDAYVHRGNVYIDLGDYKNASMDFDFVIRENPDNVLGYYNRSIANMALDRKDQALLDINQAILLTPKDSEYYNFRAVIHAAIENYDLAVEDANQVIKFGNLKTGYNNRAVIFTKKADYQAAIADWTKVIEIDSNHAIAHCRRGILYSKTNNRELAVKDLVRGLKDKTQLPDSIRQESENLLAKLQAAG
jgi:tetratricopeptide (TPR) repeat protein